MNLLRSLLFLPGNNPGMLQNAGVFGADGIIFDLEDAVSPIEKDSARYLVYYALTHNEYDQTKTIVRINPLIYGGRDDISMIAQAKPDVLMLPMIQHPDELLDIIELIDLYAGDKKIDVIPLIETAGGVANIDAIAGASDRILALAFGAEDYSVSIGTERTTEGTEILFARQKMVNAAAAHGLTAIDTPFTDVQDKEGLLKDTLYAKQIGFKGKLAINPRQIDSIHKAFTPSNHEIKWSMRVLEAINIAKQKGSGVIALDGKMIDAPIVSRAERTIKIAQHLNLITGEK